LPVQFGERLSARSSRLIYIGIATTSLLRRLGEQDLRHRRPSTFFRSIGAVLNFRPPVGSLVGKRDQNTFTFSPSDTAAIIEWINTHLAVRGHQVSPAPASADATAIRMHRPLLNIKPNPERLAELVELREECRQIARTAAMARG
jgi:hypothetical protein